MLVCSFPSFDAILDEVGATFDEIDAIVDDSSDSSDDFNDCWAFDDCFDRSTPPLIDKYRR